MNMQPVLARGARIVAAIHHSHGIKAALAISHLQERFPHWTDEFWHQALVRARWFEEPIVDLPVVAPEVEIAPRRAQVLLARSAIPVAYSAVRSWARSVGADQIVAFYLRQACASPGYLGHRLSILLAFGEAWPTYKGSSDLALYLDRLVEFLLACQFSAAEDDAAAASADWHAACTAALTHPGFFGHHLICLAWIARNRKALTDPQFRNSIEWVATAANSTYPDDEDNVTVSPATGGELTASTLEDALRELLLRGVRNIHLLTLADAIAWLWNDLNAEARAYLWSTANHYTES